jgi:hypothetical protein
MGTGDVMIIVQAESDSDIVAVQELWREYWESFWPAAGFSGLW